MKDTSPLLRLKAMFIRDTPRYTLAAFITLAYLCFQIYRTFIYPLPPLLLRPLHVASVSLLCFLYQPIKLKENASIVKKAMVKVFDLFGFIAAPLIILYHVVNYQHILTRVNYLDPLSLVDYLVCFSVLIIIIGGIWRTVGKALPLFMIAFLIYGFVSPYLPGILYYQGLNIYKLTSLLILGNEGIYGSATSAAAGFLFWIMLFGGLFSGGSGGSVLIDIGLLVGAKAKDNSAPAKAAVISSCLFGMISGSAAANVASTGVFTIPMMKKAGYSPEEAASIEAVASTGGQIMPPIMGTGAFLMADMLEMNYLRIASAALLPGIVYYAAVFLLVHLLARKRVAGGDSTQIALTAEPILPRLYMLLPVVTMVVTMAFGFTIQRSALYAIFTVLILNYISPRKHRRTTLEIFDMVMQSTKRASSVGMPLCGCGVIIGVITISGLAARMSALITSLGAQYLWIGLIITMLGCMILGMALPTSAAYLTAYVLFIPTLRSIGIGILPANLFIFYFGIFAQITPPVCMASYTAAGIAGSKPWDTGWRALTYSACAFFAPFVFVYQPGILLIGTVFEVFSSTFILVAGTILLTIGLAGYFVGGILHRWERTLFVIAGILICLPESVTDKIGFALGGIIIVYELYKGFRRKQLQAAH
jgi:TRAP transporter 4TM/12TM fusion protein